MAVKRSALLQKRKGSKGEGQKAFHKTLVDNSARAQTQADPGAISKMYPADYCNLTEFFEFPCESISVSSNFDSNTSEIQKICQIAVVSRVHF